MWYSSQEKLENIKACSIQREEKLALLTYRSHNRTIEHFEHPFVHYENIFAFVLEYLCKSTSNLNLKI